MNFLFPSFFATTLGLAFISTLLCTMTVGRYAASRLLDVPNDRSSHVRATPRGGGLAIGRVFLGAIGLLWVGYMGSMPTITAVVGGGGLVMAIGWLDYHRHVA